MNCKAGGSAYSSSNGKPADNELNGTNTSSLGLQSFQGKAGVNTFYNRGVSIGTNTAVNNSIPYTSFFGMAFSTDGSPSAFSLRKYGMFFFEDGNANHLNIYNRFQAFAVAQGFSV